MYEAECWHIRINVPTRIRNTNSDVVAVMSYVHSDNCELQYWTNTDTKQNTEYQWSEKSGKLYNIRDLGKLFIDIIKMRQDVTIFVELTFLNVKINDRLFTDLFSFV